MKFRWRPRPAKEHVEVAEEWARSFWDRKMPEGSDDVPPCPRERIGLDYSDWKELHKSFASQIEAEAWAVRFVSDMTIAKERVRAARAAESAFRWVGILLPKRIRDEEIGDALEDINRILRDPTCPNVLKAVRWKIASTWFWLAVHALGRIGAAIRGRKAE